MLAMRVPSGNGSPRLYLPVSRPGDQREVGDDPDAEVPAGGDDLGFHVAHQEAPFDLVGHDGSGVGRRGLMGRVGHLPSEVVGHRGVTHFALVDQVVEHVEGLRDGGHGIGTVLVVEVDVVGAQAAQAGLAGGDGVAPGGPPPVGTVTHGRHKLGGDDDLVAMFAQGSTQKLLRGSPSVAVRRVKHGVARLQGGVYHLGRGVLVQPHTEVVASEADHGADQPRAPDVAQFHD